MRSDLGRILRLDRYVYVSCATSGCRVELSREYLAKPAALRLARRHAAETGHTVRLRITHYQDVMPREEV